MLPSFFIGIEMRKFIWVVWQHSNNVAGKIYIRAYLDEGAAKDFASKANRTSDSDHFTVSQEVLFERKDCYD